MRSILLCTLLIAIFAGCSSTPSESTQTLRINLHTDPRSLDPGIGGERYAQIVITMLFETLMRHGPEGELVPGVAKSVEISDDYRQYTFHLRDSQWTNGLPVTADDFVCAWTRTLVPESDSLFGYAFYPILNAQALKQGEVSAAELGIKAVDDHTLVVQLEYPAPFFLELTANPVYAPVCRSVVEGDPQWAKATGGKEFVSNGPFKLVSYQPTNQIRLQRNEAYWDVEGVQLDGIEIGILSDAMTSLAQFDSGSIDYTGAPMGELPLDALPSLIERGVLQTARTGGLFWYEFNTTRVPFNNAKVRKALAYAIDREAMVEHVFHGCADVATSIVPPCMELSEGPHFPLADHEQARRLFDEGLAELGLTRDSLPAVKLSYGEREGQKALAQILQQQWKDTLGWEVQLKAQEWQVYLNAVFQKEYDVGGFYWCSWFMDPSYNLLAFKHSDGHMNGTSWEDPRFVAALDAAEQEGNPERRKAYMRDAEQVLIEEMPVTPAFEAHYHFLKSPDLKGIVLSPLGQIDFKWAHFTAA